MLNLNDLLIPQWSIQKELTTLWNHITPDEQQIIKNRMDDLFQNGLPFELKHDKILYIHVFMFLAQVDIMACQVPLKFESKVSNPEFAKKLRAQLLDEIFHVMLSIKIIYQLSTPYSYPPEINENTIKFCNYIRQEACPKVAIILLNLLSEGIAEEFAHCFYQSGLAPKVFELIIQDERRHVSDADMYFAMGLPSKETLKEKLKEFEAHLLSDLLFQYSTNMSVVSALGLEGIGQFLCNVDRKYQEQLNKLALKPGKKWQALIHLANKVLENLNQAQSYEIEMTPLRKLHLSQWDNPADPTMVGQFNLDVSCLCFFEKKYPSETLTTLILQTISQILAKHPEYSMSLNNQKLFLRDKASVCLVVKLPDCSDHLGVITFTNCHNMSVSDLSTRIRQVLAMMTYCYKKREQLEQKYPALTLIQDNILNEFQNNLFRPLFPDCPGIALSNIGTYGYTQSMSPLFPNEAMKVTIMAVQKTPVWCNATKAFIPRDLLPISISVDHRLFGGNVPVPKLMEQAFLEVFTKMTSNQNHKSKLAKLSHGLTAKYNEVFIKRIDGLLEDNLEFGYLTLLTLQSMWPDFLSIETLFETMGKDMALEPLQ